MRVRVKSAIAAMNKLSAIILPSSVAWVDMIMDGISDGDGSSNSLGEVITAISADSTNMIYTSIAYPYSNPIAMTRIKSSKNGGVTWSRISSLSAINYSGLAISDDGQTISASANPGHYMSTSGGTYFAQVDGTTYGPNAAGTFMSGDGQVIVKLSNNSTISKFSINKGSTWLSTPACGVGKYYTYAALNSDGSKFLLLDMGGIVRLSSDKGSSWTTITSIPSSNMTAMSCGMSRTGEVMLVAVSNNSTGVCSVYRSTDFGVSWSIVSAANVPASTAFISTKVSPDGNIMVISGNNMALRVSFDKGVTWSDKAAAKPWRGVSLSNTKILAGYNGGLMIGTIS